LPGVECDVVERWTTNGVSCHSAALMHESYGKRFRPTLSKSRFDRNIETDWKREEWPMARRVRHRSRFTRDRMLRRINAAGIGNRRVLEYQQHSALDCVPWHSIAHWRIVTRSPMLEEIQMARSKLSESNGSQGNKLWLEAVNAFEFFRMRLSRGKHTLPDQMQAEGFKIGIRVSRHRFVWSIPGFSIGQIVRLVYSAGEELLFSQPCAVPERWRKSFGVRPSLQKQSRPWEWSAQIILNGYRYDESPSHSVIWSWRRASFTPSRLLSGHRYRQGVYKRSNLNRWR